MNARYCIRVTSVGFVLIIREFTSRFYRPTPASRVRLASALNHWLRLHKCACVNPIMFAASDGKYWDMQYCVDK